MALSKTVLKNSKERLLAEKTRLEQELAQIGAPSGKDDADFTATWADYGDKEDENAAEVAAYSDSLGLEATFEPELKEVNEALDRIEQGIYGMCKSCGAEIPEARLDVRPQSIYCIACQEKAGR
ncbi:MAG: TraR/DksA family transcriptional regulator [Patescibacteria group bacterium]